MPSDPGKRIAEPDTDMHRWLGSIGWTASDLARILDIDDASARKMRRGKGDLQPHLAAWLRLTAGLYEALPSRLRMLASRPATMLPKDLPADDLVLLQTLQRFRDAVPEPLGWSADAFRSARDANSATLEIKEKARDIRHAAFELRADMVSGQLDAWAQERLVIAFMDGLTEKDAMIRVAKEANAVARWDPVKSAWAAFAATLLEMASEKAAA